MHGDRRGSRHGAGGLPQPADEGEHSGNAGVVVRTQRSRSAPASRLSAVVGRLRRNSRSADARRLVARDRHRGAPGARPPDSLAETGDAIAARRDEKRGLVAALLSAGLIRFTPGEDAPLDDPTAAAVHALVGGAGSILASAQFDDLVGETMATNLPGTDRERPNWRLKSGPNVVAALAGRRAQEILAALAKGRS